MCTTYFNTCSHGRVVKQISLLISSMILFDKIACVESFQIEEKSAIYYYTPYVLTMLITPSTALCPIFVTI